MPGIRRIACITVAVRDQDEALDWYTQKLGVVLQAVFADLYGNRYALVEPGSDHA